MLSTGINSIKSVITRLVDIVLIMATLCFATLFSLSAQASDKAVDTQSVDYDLLVAQTSNMPEALTSEQKLLADRLYQRVYNLYSPVYYQEMLDEIKSEIHGEIQSSTDKTISLPKQQKLNCFDSLSTLENYQKMVRYFADSYVYEHNIDEVEQTLTLLNYFFIDELAKAVAQGDNSNLDANFQSQLKAQGLAATYQGFIDPYAFIRESRQGPSLDYIEIMTLAGLDTFRTDEQLAWALESESYIDPNPYPNLMITFILSNIEACGKLGSGRLSPD